MTDKQIKKEENQPLLYTRQLDLHQLQRHMQQSVIVKQIKQDTEVKKDGKDNEENREQDYRVIESRNEMNQHNIETNVMEREEIDQHSVQIDRIEENQQQLNDEQYVKSSSETWHSKSFKDMENEEKIYFLLSRPHYIPNIKCIVKTKESSYVGVITSYTNGVLEMMASNHIGNFSLSIEDIVYIRMAGL